ncbi:hypothetical protein DYB37_010716 [Aphanomyces astaci]|uniref:EXS domain-containing protein n=1 Tax=Aphanomyces astaci TaxID=112090 RepID=A0A397FA04_APHAT|nr:hypothetical protein DYB26_009521 [Aphanomyces astaci]RHY90887.1 hypothetical protein DYB35_010648 [Aphanomyces astaci]RHZ14155.1 hypothetical protein DYB37_010716 [Aphanomyces astaci]RHZ22712.1 hypothetical protein DYB31_011203 [Aphanomyces astaci]RLO13604.1 hypothetical protein DYB28_003994 [Aphanomyces astaci]
MPSDVSYFFGGPLAINMFIAGGALNLMIFRSMGFPLEKVFGIHADEVPTPRGLITFAAFLTTLLGALYYVFKLHSIALIGRCHELVLVVYCVVVLALLTLPCNVLHVKFRRFLGRTLRRCLFPFTWVSSGGIVFAQTETPFVEVYIADGLTSMSKIFGDVAVAILMMRQSVVGVRDDMYTSKMKHHLLPYLATASPYMIRGVQCLISYHRAALVNDKFLHVLNTFKYGTGLCVILVGALPVLLSPSSMSDQRLLDTETLFLLCACCNSLYSLFWDVVMDWGLGQPPIPATGGTTDKPSAHTDHDLKQSSKAATSSSPPLWNASQPNLHAYLRHTLLYQPKAVYFAALAIDALLRVLWVTSNWHWVDVVGADFKMVAQVAEVCRRCMWNFFRVEWQCVKLGWLPPLHPPASRSTYYVLKGDEDGDESLLELSASVPTSPTSPPPVPHLINDNNKHSVTTLHHHVKQGGVDKHV